MAVISQQSSQAPAVRTGDRWEKRLLPATLVLAGLFVITTSAFVAIERDEGLALSMGMAIRDGYLPYRDFFENRPPALHYLLSLLFRFTTSLWPTRALVLLVNVFGAALAARLAQELGGSMARWWAVLFYSFAILLFHGYWLIMEPFVAALLLLALWLHGVRRQPELAALAAVASMWFKQTAWPSAWALLVVILWQARGLRRLSILGAALSGAALPAWLFWRAGLVDPFLEQTVSANVRTASSRWPALAEFVRGYLAFLEVKGLLWVIWAAGLAELLKSLPLLHPTRARLAGALIVVSLAAWIVALPTPGMHYFFPVAALGSVAAGIVTSRWLGALAQPRHRLALMALIILPLLAGGAIPALSVLKQGYVFRQLALARRLEALTSPGERVLVVHYSPMYYFLARRYPPVPTFFLYWINDTPEMEERMVQSLGPQVRIAVIVEQPDSDLYGARVSLAIRSRGTRVYTDPGLKAEIWAMPSAP